MSEVKDNLEQFRQRREQEVAPDEASTQEQEQQTGPAVLNHNEVFAQMLMENGGSRKQVLALYARGGLNPIAESIVEACTTPEERTSGFINVLTFVVSNFLQAQQQAINAQKEAQAKKIAVAQAVPASKLHI